VQVDHADVALAPLHPAHVRPVQPRLLLTFEVWQKSIVKSSSSYGVASGWPSVHSRGCLMSRLHQDQLLRGR
jgi:hypothetical protein